MDDDSLANIEALLEDALRVLKDIRHDTGFLSERFKKR